MIRRYWATILGAAAIAAFVIFGVLKIGHATVDSLIETAMKEKIGSFAELLMSDRGDVDAFLTGLSRDADAEQTIRTVAGLADIDSFAVFDRTGREVFRSRSDRYKWLLRDRPGGISSGDRLSKQVLDSPGEWRIVTDDGHTNPSVITPLIRNGQTIGYVSVVANMIEDRSAYTTALAGASISLLLTILVATGVPALIYIRRHRKIAEADDRIQFLANHDPLTHLFNRTRMNEETTRLIATSRATREQMAFCFIDIDGLSEINDGLGQMHGDKLLRVVASRLSAATDGTGALARIGADDFVLLRRRYGDAEEFAVFIERMKQALCEPAQLGDYVTTPQISIGVALMPRDGRSYSELVKHAELALNHQKATRTASFTVFETYMDEEVHRRRQIETMVRDAVANDGFELFYQPLVSGDGAKLLGFEALIRMRDPAGGYISPVEFIPIAESRGYIKDIGTWVIREATRQIALWPQDLFMSVNLSAIQFKDGDLVSIVEDALSNAGISGDRLEVEVVESLLLERSDDILGQLKGLKALGISVAMDDFGTGYSSLGYLWRFPFDKLKIDQSFMSAFTTGEQNVRAILDTIISLAHLMHMKVTAEGVETTDQVKVLKDLGCDQLQGYLFSKPVPADRVAAEILTRFGQRAAIALTAAEPASKQQSANQSMA